MLKYICQRLIAAAITLFVILTLAFMVVRFMPGSVYDDPNLPAEVVEILEEKDHLNDPLLVQYGYFLAGVIFENDWGTSVQISPGVGAFDVLSQRIPVSLVINLAALIFALPVGMVCGIVAALKKNQKIDTVISIGVIIGVSVPSFVFASLLQYFVGYKTGLLPILYSPTGTWGEKLLSMVLPIIALSLGSIATITRYLRGELIEVLGSDYIVLAKTKGLTDRQTTVRHALRNSSIPMLNVVVPLFANVLGGSMVVEQIFSIPGVGGLMVDSINVNDYSLTVATLLFYAFLSILSVLVVDLLYGVVDPRVRVGG